MTAISEPQTVPVTPGKAPFGTLGLILAGLFLGVWGAGIMASINWRRMGRPGRAYATYGLMAAFVVAVVAVASAADFLAAGPLQVVGIQGFPMDRILQALVAVGFALLVAQLQAGAYRQWLGSTSPTGGAWSPTIRDRGGWKTILIIIGASLGLAFVVSLAVGSLFSGPSRVDQSASADRLMVDSAFELTYSGRWTTASIDQLFGGQCPQGHECVAALTTEDGYSSIVILRMTGAASINTPLAVAAEQTLDDLERQSNVEILEPIASFVLSGRIAQQFVYSQETSRGLFRQRVVVTKQPDGKLLYILASTPEDAPEQTLADIDAIIASIRFRE